ncbi:MAG: hypothetical protein KYX66_12440 [Blastomonas fulva]|uniref:hypothetical protein n=1 Tax=Blastomonas fulva TaxID=1550728 RepID=UPI0024E1CF77|nr:hypothetical protein [Blastomonas fulva]MDK2757534.1 hypothetical protein [Blastomonas fulva]
MSEPSDLGDLKVKVGWLLMHQARVNLTVTKILAKLATRETVEGPDLADLVDYVNLSLERSDEIITLLGIKTHDD